ncbi:MAG: hypothetical protein DHS20C21_00050 [Gemmatimonadota bacterium]|nr:MAG: hypothetical protein DHS20C21_00050 [Gemmatimonadota bacterium]
MGRFSVATSIAILAGMMSGCEPPFTPPPPSCDEGLPAEWAGDWDLTSGFSACGESEVWSEENEIVTLVAGEPFLEELIEDGFVVLECSVTVSGSGGQYSFSARRSVGDCVESITALGTIIVDGDTYSGFGTSTLSMSGAGCAATGDFCMDVVVTGTRVSGNPSGARSSPSRGMASLLALPPR